MPSRVLILRSRAGAPAPLPILTLGPLTPNPADEGQTLTATVTLTRAAPTGGVTYAFAVTGTGSAPVDTADFVPGTVLAGTRTIAAGQTTDVLSFPLADDATEEPAETLQLAILSATGATLAATPRPGTITPSDPLVVTPPPPGAGPRFITRGTGPTAVQIELARGVTSAYDIRYDEASDTLTGTLWPWDAERVGVARHAAIPSGRRRTVTQTGTAGGSQLVGFVQEFANGTGDWEVILPAGQSVQLADVLDLPNVAPRRLYLTASTLPTADAMPTLTAMAAQAVIVGTTATRSGVIRADGGGAACLTLTGVVVRAGGPVQVGILDFRNISTPATTLADVPKGLVLDRVWLDGSGQPDNVRRGLMANMQQIAALECYLTGVSRGTGQEGCGWGGYSGARWHYRRNVLIEASSLGVLYGGTDPDNPDSGLLDPADHCDVQTVSVRNTAWLASNGATEMGKNLMEAKNVARWTIYRLRGKRHIGGGQNQYHAVLFQNLTDGNTNGQANRIEDVALIAVDIDGMQNGINLLSRVAYDNNGRAAVMPTVPMRRIAMLDVRLRGLGRYANPGNFRGNAVQLQSDIQDLVLDRWTAPETNTDSDKCMILLDVPTPGARWTLTNVLGALGGYAGCFGRAGGENNYGQQGRAALLLATGNALTYGGFVGWAARDRSPSIMQPGLTYFADATAAGVSVPDGVLAVGAAARAQGIAGADPGARPSVIAALMAATSWADAL